jgi:hypothetical protein
MSLSCPPDAYATTLYFVLDELAPPDSEIHALVATRKNISAEVWCMGAVVYKFVEKYRIHGWICEAGVEDKKCGAKVLRTELSDSGSKFYIAVFTIMVC